MSALENQRVIHNPSVYRDGNIPNTVNITGNEDERPPKFVNLRVEAYTGLINAVVIVSILLFISIGYIIWLHCFRRRSTKRSMGLDEEKVSNRSNLRQPETPETYTRFVLTSLNKPRSEESSTKFARQVTNCTRSNSGGQSSPSDSPSTSASFSPVFPVNQTRIPERETAPSTPGMSVGDRLRTQKMLREITGSHPASADSTSLNPVVATLGLGLQQEGNHSRSSLYTIAETVHERSTLSSPEPVSAPPSSTKFTHDAGQKTLSPL